jgi:hypothetical protein
MDEGKFGAWTLPLSTIDYGLFILDWRFTILDWVRCEPLGFPFHAKGGRKINSLSRQEGFSPSSLSQNRTWNSRFIRLVLIQLHSVNSSLKKVGKAFVHWINPSPLLHSNYRTSSLLWLSPTSWELKYSSLCETSWLFFFFHARFQN